jgi:glyoxylase-like metal-dependent hydrolase (beta-lactamase superfamily II)
MSESILKGFALGPFATNTYVVGCGTRCWIVDPSFGPAPVIAFVRDKQLTVDAIVLTHAHVDHIAGIADVQKALGPLPVWIHEAEAAWLGDPERNLSSAFGMPVSLPDASRLLHDGDELSIGDHTWRVLHVPGHSPGSIALASAGVVIGGDALFAGSIGRTDFPGSSFDTLEASIRRKLYTLPDATVVHPGHGPATTIGREKQSNPYVRP